MNHASRDPSLQQQIQYHVLPAEQLQEAPFQQLLPQDAYSALTRGKQYREQFAIAALLRSKVVGVALASRHLESAASQAELLWLFVSPHFRRQGIASGLLHKLEDETRHRGLHSLQMTMSQQLKDLQPLPPDLNGCLQSSGWTPFLPTTVIIEGRINTLAQCPWLKRARLFPGYSMFLWKDLSDADRSAIIKRNSEERWYPETLDPFDVPQGFEPINSLGLRRGSDVIGWLITHRVAPRKINYSDAFISPELQYAGLYGAILARSIQLHIEHPEVPLGRVKVHYANKPMVNFLKKRLQPYADVALMEFSAHKKLSVAPP